MLTITDFQIKDVVNVADGKKLGNITDLDINLVTGKIDAIIIQTGSKMMGFFGKNDEVVVPWSNIVKIGTDVILVRYFRTNYHDDDEIEAEVKAPKTFY
ncbi:sporulation protein, YlmC/YmxH family [Schinkia azotoformans MEV2011]|uniref:Sporulation protein, YlmC/YmxH family n=2 Tax=Schinkia azotoformans TaxID=1454 RepID=A0A072NN28_SCHAZ|nr:YlmC/YmxH family sporulation protein [Schinkia azotoformans]EKN68875.1 putative sporulation protein YlmC [Schinkia azotoformans LMG 9581]KEF38627.1 sporulation protein, YlmC/YmxH family [Schinkia azotoformans MEV2011]MEC1638348.1 YlmC/YmxH family sporulation protein [Schinkia azotoformans]MEC1698059.1 YlmC/YmxH family sporulation protein [Schinkia azotoformans]MEC1715381.1 YlmC/YmxH family sporulation protein [Schinkia azotoformans]